MPKSDRRIARSVGLRRPIYRKLDIARQTVLSFQSVRPDYDEKGVSLKAEDIQLILAEDGWLDGNMIHRAMNFINKEHSLQRRNGEEIPWGVWKAEALPTYWFENIESGKVSWKWMTKWMNKKGLTKGQRPRLDCVIIPWHHKDHWTLALVFPLHRKVAILDSLEERIKSPTRAAVIFAQICKWLDSHMKDDFQEQEWILIHLRCPQQENGNDCGVHLVLNAWFLSKGIWPMAHEKLTPGDRRLFVAYMVNKGTKDCPIGIW